MTGHRFALFAVLLVVPLSAQAPGRYVERISTEVLSRTATAELTRTLLRESTYDVTHRGDTVVVQVVAARLEERDRETTAVHDTDGFVGGRWKLLRDAAGVFRVVDAPFVPPAVMEVSDLAQAMDDFFMPAPPRLAVGAQGNDMAGRAWQRDADSSGVRRYRWDVTRTHDSTAVVRDTIRLEIAESVRESSQLRLDARDAPFGWSREIVTEVTSRGAGRAVRATVRHRIAVRVLR